MSEKDHKVSRRQFLTYTLTGVGGFMAAGILMPMTRFALDPALKTAAESSMVPIKLKPSEVTEVPQMVKFTYEQVDGWYTSDVTKTAWIFKEGDEIIALSPKCTHLGCDVDWEAGDHSNEFFCPCHFGRFEKSGKNVAGTPPTEPLHKFELKIEDDVIYLGNALSQK